MRIRDWFGVAIVGLLLSGCAGLQQAPSDEARAALAPTGKLRAAFFLAPVYGLKDPATGEMKGLAVDLGKELARQLGVPFEPRPYKDLAALIESAKSGEWDVAMSTVDEKRATVIDYSAPYMLLEQGYLVRAGAPIATMADVDKEGIRVGVVKKSASQAYVAKTLKTATLVEVDNLADLKELLVSGKVEAIAIGKTFLYAVSEKLPGSRVLDGAIVVDEVALGVAKGRNAAGLDYVKQFIGSEKARNLVKNAMERDKMKGVRIAPPR